MALVGDQPGRAVAEVNPSGSMSYGVAIVTLSAEGGTDRMVCILDEATGAAKTTAPWTTLDEGRDMPRSWCWARPYGGRQAVMTWCHNKL